MKCPRHREQQQTDQREGHSGGQRHRRGPTVGDQPDDRLQDRGGEHQGESHHADLRKAQVEGALEHGVDRWQQRLQGVVQKVGQTNGGEHGVRRFAGFLRRPPLCRSRPPAATQARKKVPSLIVPAGPRAPRDRLAAGVDAPPPPLVGFRTESDLRIRI